MRPPWYDDIGEYVRTSAWAGRVGTYQDVLWRSQQDPSDELLMVTPEQIAEAVEQLEQIQADWAAAKEYFSTAGQQLPPIDWGKPPAKSLGAGTTPLISEVPEDEVPAPEAMADAEYVESIASDLEMRPESILDLMKQVFPDAENAVAAFRDAYGEMGPAAGLSVLQSAAEAYLGAPTPTTDAGWTGGYPGVGVGGVGGEAAVGAGFDYPPSAFYGAMSEVMSPLQGADELDFLARFAQPGQYYPSTFYSLIGKSMLPMGMNMPGEFYGMMEGAMPSDIAPGTPAPDFSFLGGLGQAPMPELGAFLVSLLQSNPELGLALMEAAIGMQQEYAMPFLPLLFAGQGGGGGAPVGSDDYSAGLLGGV